MAVFTSAQRRRIKSEVQKGSYTKYGYSKAAFQKVRSEQGKLYGVSTQTITRVLNGEKV